MNRQYIAILISVVIHMHVLAQTERLYTVNSELPSSMITALAQDSVGNIWIGTENGLCRYDGAKFVNYSHRPNDSASLLSNTITALLVTTQGQVMVGTQKGLQMYNSDYDTFEKFQLSYMDKDDIKTYVSSILELNDGRILISTLGNGILAVDMQSKKGVTAIEPNNRYTFTRVITANEDNSLWIADGRNGALRGIWNPDGHIGASVISGTEGWNIESIVTDSKGNAYYATQYGVHRISLDNLSHELVLSYNKHKFLDMKLVDDNILLLATEGNGLMAYNLSSKSFTGIGYNTGRTDISKARINTILVDRSDNLWLGLYQRGVLACRSQSDIFGYIGQGSASRDIIGTNPVMALYATGDNTLWVITDRDGLYAIRDDDTRHYPQGTNGLPSLITNMYQTKDGTLWIESIDKGLTRFNASTGICTAEPNFGHTNVFDIVEDRQGRLWIATMGDGLFCTDHNANILYKAPYTDHKHFTPGADLLSNRWINSLTISNDSTKLFINTCYGVGCYDMEMGSFVNTFGENHILDSKMCYDSYHDPDGYLWIGTTDGVYRWHSETDEIAHFDTDNGLCNNTVVGISHDSQGNIWVATLYGLSKIDRTTEAITCYYVNDGLQGNEFTPRSMVRNVNGHIYAGGINGITIFDDINREIIIPKLRIADVYLHGKAINLATESNGKPVIVQRGDKRIYEFDSKDKSICIELTTDIFASDNIRYQYSIDSGEWQSLQPRTNKLIFSNLSAGNHTIALKASLYDNESEIEYLHIHIRQVWYLRWWAILMYFAIVLTILGAGYQIWHNRRSMVVHLAEQKRKDCLNNATMQFLMNVSSEIRASISLISNPIEQLSEIHDDTESRHLLTIIRNNINRILLLANQMRDVRKIDQKQMQLELSPTEMVAYVRNATKALEPIAQKKNIDLSFDAGPSLMYAMIDQYQFDKVIYNLLYNAINVSNDGGHIDITMSSADDKVTVCITDDNVVVPEHQLSNVFDRFYQNDNPNGYIHQSSGIGVHLSSLLVGLHEGSIKAVSAHDGHGVSIVISLPACKVDECQLNDNTENTDNNTGSEVLQHISNETEYELTSKNLRSKPTLAIIESNAELRKYLHEQLQSNYNIVTFERAKDALAQVRNNKPDMVIIDTDHQTNGTIQTIKAIRHNININDLPIIVLSTQNDESDIIAAIEEGADYYMAKPFNIKLLKSYIESLIVQRQRLKVIYQGSQLNDEIVTGTTDIKTPDDQLMERLSRSIEANISNPNYTIVDLASDVCMSRVHLNRKLKQLTNQSPSTYLRNMRLAKAAELLRANPGITVSDVATAVGMTSFSHFSHVFKELYGCTPSEYAIRYHN